MTFAARILSVCLLCAALSAPVLANPASGDNQKNVLILNSYHHNYKWSDDSIAGIVSTLKSAGGIECYVEHMDARRLPHDTAEKHTIELLRNKYPADFFHTIITLDDHAFKLMLSRREELFPYVPVVFMGLNSFNPAELAGRKNYTGVIQRPDFNYQVTLARELFPDTRNIYFMADNSITGAGFLQEVKPIFNAIAAQDGSLNFNYLSGASLTHREMLNLVATLPDNSVLFLSTWHRDKNNEYWDPRKSYPRISSESRVPLFCFVKSDVGLGPLGGCVISGQSYGAQAARMALRILRGESTSLVPIDYHGIRELAFDFHQARRWKVQGRLPAGSLIINRPFSSIEEYYHLILAGGIIVITTTAVLAAFVLASIRKNRSRGSAGSRLSELEETLEALGTGHWVYHGAGKTFSVSSQFLSILGRERISSPRNLAEWATLIHADDRDKAATGLQELIHSGKPCLRHELRVLHGNGKYIWIVIEVAIQERGPDGKNAFVASGLIRDISAAKNQCLELESRLRVRDRVLDLLPFPLACLDQRRRIVWNNRQMDARTGEDARDCRALPCCREHKCESCVIQRCLAGEGQLKCEYPGDDGKTAVCAVIPIPGESPSTDVHGVLVMIQDIGEQRRVEQYLTAARDKAEAARIEAEKANRAKSDFLASMSHEIRNSMNGITGTVDLLLQTPLNQEQRQYAGTIEHSGDTLLKLINAILDLSRIEAGKLKLEREHFKLDELLNQCLEIARAQIRNKALDISLEIQAGSLPPELIGDPTRLKQVINNLMSNAIKFTDSGFVKLSVSSVRIDQHHQSFTFTIGDNGIGIDSETLEHIFEKYFQAGSASTRGSGGSGLGLAISSELVKLMRGSISATSTPGKGSVFQFSIPLRVSGHSNAPAPVENKGDNTANMAMSVLIAEDSKVNQLVLADFLTKQFGCQVHIAENGQEVIEFLDSGTPCDLVFMDCQMPVMDGYSASAAIRASNKDYAKITIIAMTADAMPGTREKCLEAGMDDYATKPIRLQNLRSIMDKLMRERIQV